MHVEVIVDRLRERFGVEVALKPPRVPYQETIRSSAKAHGRHKKQSGGRGQFGDCQIEIEPLRAGMGFEFVDQIKGGAIPSSFIPAVEKGVREAMSTGVLAGYPVKDVRVRLYDGSHHSVDSSEIAFKLAGAQAMREALRVADPVLLEPIMLVTLSVPEECVGDVIGDLNSRRGRPQGMEPAGGMTEIKAEAPMAEMLSYAPDLRSITGGQGDYTLEFLRYEEVPAHLAQKIVQGVARRARRRRTPEQRPRPESPRHPIPWGPPMATRSIVTSQPDVACDVCGRRLLRGEQPDVFLASGRRRTVCELCAPRASAEGWMREIDGQSVSLSPARPRRGRNLFDRLRQQRERVQSPDQTAFVAPGAPEDADEASSSSYDFFDGGSAPASPSGSGEVTPAASDLGQTARPVPAVPFAGADPAPVENAPRGGETLSGGDGWTMRALEVFNAGEHPRRVAGVSRSLGAPEVTIRPLASPGAHAWRSSSPGSCAGTGTRSISATRRPGERHRAGDRAERTRRRGPRRERAADAHGALSLVASVGVMIYCVVPKPLADELYPKLAEHYADEDNVTVIVDRRESDRRARGARPTDAVKQQRVIRDRRRARVPGDMPPLARAL